MSIGMRTATEPEMQLTKFGTPYFDTLDSQGAIPSNRPHRPGWPGHIVRSSQRQGI
ncbi:hypothetical protein ABIA39_008558 [Nocardia sp. GAS34]